MKGTLMLNHGGCPIAQIQLEKNLRERYRTTHIYQERA